MRRSRYFLFLILILTTLTSCHNNATTNEADSTYCFLDDYGRECTVPLHPQRIVSVSPAVTEIIFALGADELLVGRTDYCVYPKEVQRIESIGGISNLNIEKILSLHPDLVISGSMVPEATADHLVSMGVAIPCIPEKEHFTGLYDNIEKIGQLIDRKEAAQKLIALLKEEVAACGEIDTNASKTAYYAVGFGKAGNFTAGGNTFINDILKMAGLKNIASDITGWNISLEALMDANPDYIIIRKEDKEAFCKMSPYNTLKAVVQGHVIPIESGMIDLQSPRNIEAIRIIREASK